MKKLYFAFMAVIMTLQSCILLENDLDTYNGSDVPSDDYVIILSNGYHVRDSVCIINGVSYKNPDSIDVDYYPGSRCLFITKDNSLVRALRYGYVDQIFIDSDDLQVCTGGKYVRYHASFYRIPDVGAPELSDRIVSIQVINGVVVDAIYRGPRA